jgi:hypothetical protein
VDVWRRDDAAGLHGLEQQAAAVVVVTVAGQRLRWARRLITAFLSETGLASFPADQRLRDTVQRSKSAVQRSGSTVQR